MMATKHDNIFVAIIVVILWLLIGIPAEADTYILTGADSTSKVFDAKLRGGGHISYKYKNYGATGAIRVSWNNDLNDYYEYGLIDFDLSGFPGTVDEVDTVRLFLVATNVYTSWISGVDTFTVDTASVEVRQVLVQWGEGVGDGDAATSGECCYMDSSYTDDWNSEGCNGSGTDISATPTGWQQLTLEPASNHVDTLYMDVTDDVKNMLADPVHPNEYAGWKLTPVGFDVPEVVVISLLAFVAKDASGALDAFKPQLIIYYTPAVEGQVILID